MRMEHFLQAVGRQLENELGEFYEVKVTKTLKNNDYEAFGFSIAAMGEKVYPTLYVNDYYEKYQNHEMNLREIVEDLLEEYHVFRVEKPEFLETVPTPFSWEDVRDKVVVQMVSKSRNGALLQSVPHFEWVDLAVVFRVVVDCHGGSIQSVLVKNDIFESWDVTTEELKEIAIENSKRLFPLRMEPMSQTLKEESLIQEVHPDFPEMMILTNEFGINGASVILYEEGQLEYLAKQCQTDLILIPSSIHEFLVLPKSDQFTRDSMNAMVRDVNENLVSEDEILSDRIYYYEWNQKEFIPA